MSQKHLHICLVSCLSAFIPLNNQFFVLPPVAVFTVNLPPLMFPLFGEGINITMLLPKPPSLILLVKPLYGCFFMRAVSCSGFSGNSQEAGKFSTVVSFDIYPQ